MSLSGLYRFLSSCFLVFSCLIAFAKELPSASFSAAGIAFPVVFEENRGQFDEQTRFLARNADGAVHFLKTGPEFVLGRSKDQVRLQLLPAGPEGTARLSAEELMPGTVNYFVGQESSAHFQDIPTYGRVRYSDFMPGVDLTFYGTQHSLEHDFVVAPGVSPDVVRFRIKGASSVQLGDAGKLAIHTTTSKLVFRKPVAYQIADGKKNAVDVDFILGDDDTISFRVGQYDSRTELVIDPVLVFSSYLDGTHADTPTSIATDGSGNIYVAGYTTSPDFPMASAYQATCGLCADGGFGESGYLAKLDPTGSTLLYSTYFVGNGQTDIWRIRVDSLGNLVGAGYTASTNFPRVGNYSGQYTSGLFIFSLNPTGKTLNHSEIVGVGTSATGGYGALYGNPYSLAVDGTNNIYVAGVLSTSGNFAPLFPLTPGTYSSAFPSTPAYSVFVMKVASDGSLIYSSIVPSSAQTTIGGLVVDSAGNTYISGTAASGLPTTAGTVSPTYPNGTPVNQAYSGLAGFVMSFNATASQLRFSTYLPGTDNANTLSLATDGSLYVAGTTSETTLPVSANAFQTTLKKGAGCTCDGGYVLRLNSTGTQVLNATYLSGTNDYNNTLTEYGSSAFDSTGNIYLGGIAYSTDFPMANPVASFFDITGNIWAGGTVLAGLSPNLSQLVFGSYFNGYGAGDRVADMTVSNNNRMVLTGGTFSNTNFPTTVNAYEPNAPASPSPFVGYSHQFVASIDLATPAPSACFDKRTVAFGSTPANTTGYATVQLTNCGNAPLTIQSITSASALVAVSQPCVTVAAGASCALQFSFSPTSSASLTSTITILSNTTIPSQLLYVTGQGTAPKLSTSASVSFGQSLVGSSTPILGSVLVQNTGNATLNFSGASVTGDFVIVSNSCKTTLAATANTFCLITLSFTPTTSGLRSGVLTISSNDPVTPQTNIALSGTGLNTYPAPVLISLSTPTQVISTTNVSIQLLGNNFFPQSLVLINGQPAVSRFNSGSSMTATIPPSFLSSIGELSLTVYNPAPGGGESLPQLLTVYQSLALSPNHLVSVPSTGMLYASMASTASTNPNTVVPINATTGAVGAPIPVGQNPTLLAASSDGKYLYVTLANDHTVQRINLQTQTVERTFAYGPNIYCSSCALGIATDLQVVPGNSQEVVLSQGSILGLYNDSGLVNFVPGSAVYDFAPDFDSFAIAGTPQTIYALPFTDVQNSFFSTAILNSNGLQYTSITGTNFGGNNTTGNEVVTDGTLLYTSAGEVWNPATGVQAGTFPVTTVNSTSYPNIRNLAIDTTLGELYTIGDQAYGSDSGAIVLTAYGQHSLAITGSLAFLQINSAIVTDLVRWGPNGFAFLGSGNLYIVSSSVASPQIVNPLPSLASLSASSAVTGGPAITLTLNGTNFLPNSTVSWSGTALSVTYVNSTQLTVVVPAYDLAVSGMAELSVSNPGPGGGTSVELAFTIASLPAPTISFSIAGHTFGDAPFQLSASSNSTGALSYSVLSGPATISGSTLTITGAGTVSVQASQLASGAFGALSQTASFAIQSAIPSISWTPSATSINGGSPLGTGILNASASVPGSFVYTAVGATTNVISATTVLTPGIYKISAVFTPSDTTDYTASSASIMLTVKASTTVAVSSSASPVVVLNPVTFTASVPTTATGTVTFMDGMATLASASVANGIATCTTSSLVSGSHAITATYSGDAYFVGSVGAFTQVVQDFTLSMPSGSSSSQTAQRGSAATYSFVVNSAGTPLPEAVTFTVGGLPAGATATFSPASLPTGAGATPVTLTVQIPQSLARIQRGMALGGFGSLALICMPFLRHRKYSLMAAILIFCASLATSALLGCGGSPSSSASQVAPETYTLTVTATAGADAHTTMLTLVVQ